MRGFGQGLVTFAIGLSLVQYTPWRYYVMCVSVTEFPSTSPVYCLGVWVRKNQLSGGRATWHFVDMRVDQYIPGLEMTHLSHVGKVHILLLVFQAMAIPMFIGAFDQPPHVDLSFRRKSAGQVL